MNKLQQLLDEKWPIKQNIAPGVKAWLDSQRHLFSEGYNAAIKLGKELADQVVFAENAADTSKYMVDNPHVLAIRASAQVARKFLEEANK